MGGRGQQPALAAGGPRARLYDMERQCCEQADFLVSPSAYLLGWMRGRGWRLPGRSEVIPNFTAPLGAVPPRRPEETSPPRELVFFGRLEERKGLRVFCEALRLPPRNCSPGAR